MIIADTGALISYLDALEPEHERVTAIIDAERDPIVISPFVLAELDYLVGKRLGARAARGVLDELSGGAYEIALFAADDVRRALRVLDRHVERRLGLTDASLVVLADRYGSTTVLTVDRRDFEGLTRSDGTPLTILP
ncbi:MAG: hypothetical protein RL190_726 [Actinomycetota bacterium]